MKRFALVVAVALVGCMKPKEGVARGAVVFEGCVACHGQNGEGRANLAAPAIAGLPAWYVQAQLKKFKTGVRGAHPDDLEGLRMRPMSQQIWTDADGAAVAAHIASLPVQPSPATLKDADAAAGQGAYGVCLACHGPDGKGNEALKSPPISQLPDWYVVSQLKKFKSGVRGANPADTTGAQMLGMAKTLADDQAIKNVAAHIATLAKR